VSERQGKVTSKEFQIWCFRVVGAALVVAGLYLTDHGGDIWGAVTLVGIIFWERARRISRKTPNVCALEARVSGRAASWRMGGNAVLAIWIFWTLATIQHIVPMPRPHGFVFYLYLASIVVLPIAGLALRAYADDLEKN
jgi:hypothetical protein